MTAVLVRLKLRLLVNGLRASSARFQFFLLSASTALAFSVGGFLLFSAGPPRLPSFAFPMFAAFWAILPLVAFGVDETLDPARLAVLPLRRRDVIPGLLVSAAAGPWPLAFLVMLLGCVPGYGRSAAGAAVALAAVLVTFVFCLALSRAVATSMARLLRSRRGRDLGVLLGTGLAMLIVVAGQTFQPRTTFGSGGVTSVLRWTPTGLTGHALFAVRRDRLATAVLEIAACALATLLVLGWWAMAVNSAQVPSDASASGGRRMRFGARTARAAVAGKELRYALRDPVRRAQLPSLAVSATMFTLTTDTAGSAYPVVGVAVLSALALGSNQIGEDGSAYWLHVLTGESALIAKNLVRGGFAALVTTAAGAGAVLLGRDWGEVVPVLLTAYGGLLLALGMANVIAVRVPFPPPASANPFATDPGKGCASGAYALAAIVACGLLLAPSILLGLAGLRYPGAVLALAVGAGGWVVGTRIAQRFAEVARPEILAAIVRNGG